MKQNPLIMAEFGKALSEVDHDVVNILLHSLQNELKLDGASIDLFNYDKIFDRKVVLKASDFKELGKFGKNANEAIFESLKKIRDTSAVVRNFRDIDNRIVKAKTVSLIDDVRWLKDNADKRDHSFEVQFNEWFLQISTKHFNTQVGNYASVQIDRVSSIKGKHAKKLYELVKSQKWRGTSFSLSYSELQKIFNLDGKDFSYIVRILKSSKPKVDKFIPFKCTPFKKDKLVSFEYE
jgi:hypothetical protein